MTDASSSAETARVFLRRETEPWHRAVERAFSPLDLALRSDLGCFLQAQAAAVIPVEAELAAAGVSEHVPDWPSRRRSAALREDLEALRLSVPEIRWGSLDLMTRSHQLGALYVLEGSRLGGRLLARRIAASDDPAVRRAKAFLCHDPGQGAWRDFLAVLDRVDGPRDDLLAGAIGVFERFRVAFRGVTTETAASP